MTSKPLFGVLPPEPSSDDRATFDYAPHDPNADAVVTFVTPFFDAGATFEDTATSVLRQTLQQWEWVIVNDGSSDRVSLDVLDEFRESDPRIRIVDLVENRGPGAARNAGVSVASAAYVVLLDSDDLLEPTMSEILAWYLESHPNDAFVQGHTVGFGVETYVWESGFHDRERFLEGNRAGVTAMIRTSVYREVGGFDERNRDGLEDWDFWLKCAAHGHWGGTVHTPLSWYRRRDSHGDQWRNWDGGPLEDAFRKSMKDRYPVLWDGGFPQAITDQDVGYEPIGRVVPFTNDLVRDRPHLMMVVPWMTIGGADKFNLDLVAGFVDRGWSVTIATTLENDDAWEREFARYTPDIFPMHRFLRDVDHPRFLRYLIASRTPDVVLISNSELGYELAGYLRAQCPDPAYIDLVHAEQDDWKHGGHANFSNLYRHQLDLSIVVSDHLRSWMIDRGGDGSRIVVSHLGVDETQWAPDDAGRRRERDELGVSDGTVLVLYSGRLAEEKQPEVFAKTIRRLVVDGHDILAVVAGDGPERPWLEAFVAENNLAEHVRILGFVPTTRMIELLRAADIFFLPSKREGIALTIYEAMSCGIAVVAADVGGQSELVTSDTGILVVPSSPELDSVAYGDAIASLIMDPERRSSMGANGRRRIVERFSVSMMLERLPRMMDQARELHETDPRPLPVLDAVVAQATLAIEYHRLERSFDSERSRPSGSPDLGPASFGGDEDDHDGHNSGRRLYKALMAALGGGYRHLKRRYPTQVIASRDRVRSVLGYRR